MILTNANENLGTVVLREVKIEQNQAGTGCTGKVCIGAQKRQRLSPVLCHFEIARNPVQTQRVFDEINIRGIIFGKKDPR